MKLGDKGPDVQKLQERLNKAGTRPSLIPDGLFGQKTRLALMTVQGLIADELGEAGTLTVLALENLDRFAGVLSKPGSGTTSADTRPPGVRALAQGFVLKGFNIREELGPNRGLELNEHIQSRYGEPQGGSAWCARFVGTCCEQAGLTDLPEHMAQQSCSGWMSWAQKTGRLHAVGTGYVPKKGDLFLHGSSHIGFYVGPGSSESRFESLEGNRSDKLGSFDVPFGPVTHWVCMQN